MELELLQQPLYGDFLHGRGLFPFLIGLFGLFFRWVDRVGKVVLIRHPETALEIIESADTWGVADREAGKDGMEIVLFQVSRPLCIGSDLALHREQDGAEHVRGKPWCRAEVGIPVSHDGIHIGEVKAPELLHNFPNGSRQRRNSIWIVFT
nr:hypothetical protein [uncultured Acetatifactor sp.]